MKIAIIGAGSIGSAIAFRLSTKGHTVNVSNPSQGKLDSLKAANPDINVTTSNLKCISGAEIIFICVKPHMVSAVISEIRNRIDDRIVVSVAAGIGLSALREMIGGDSSIFYAIPNTAITTGESMTFICSQFASDKDEKAVMGLFDLMGKSMKIEESRMGAYMALSSCGIAYALRYIRAAMSGGIEMGLRADMAQEVICQTVIGAASLLSDGKSHPEKEIDKVCTPGGYTIKGLNAMEAEGFTAAVISGLKASRI